MIKIAKVEDMIVYKRTEQLMFRTYDAITKYPNAEKFCLAQKTKNTFFEVLTYMSLGNDVKSKRREYLQTADGYLHMLKVCFRLARYRKYIGKEFHRQISLELTEIGKMLGAWIRSYAIGFKIYPTHMLLRNESKKRVKQKLRKFKRLLVEEKITIEKVEQILNSWYGHAEQANSYMFVQSLLDRFDYIELVDKKSKNGKIKKVFKIKREVIDDARKTYISSKEGKGMGVIYT